MRYITALLAIATTVFALGAVELQTDFEPATIGAPQLEVKQVGEIEIPGESNDVTLMVHHGNRFYLGAPSADGGLHCYSLPDYEHLWTASLGEYRDDDSTHRMVQGVPSSMVFSKDGQLAFMEVAGVDDELLPRELVAFDLFSAKVSSKTELRQYGHLEPVTLAGRPVLVHKGAWHLRVFEQADLTRKLIEVDETLIDQDAEVIPQMSDRFLTTLVVDEESDRLYSATENGYLLRFDISDSPEGPTLEHITAPACAQPWMSAWIDGELAVIDHESGELGFYDPQSLDKTGVMQSLQYARFLVNIENLLYVISNISDEDDTGDLEAFHFNARLQVVDPNHGEVFFQLFPDSSIREIAMLDDGVLALASEGSLAFLEDSESGNRFPTWTTAHGAIWLLDTETWEFIGEAQYPEGCARVNFNGTDGELVLAQYNHADVDGPKLQDTLKIMQIELP